MVPLSAQCCLLQIETNSSGNASKMILKNPLLFQLSDDYSMCYYECNALFQRLSTTTLKIMQVTCSRG